MNGAIASANQALPNIDFVFIHYNVLCCINYILKYSLEYYAVMRFVGNQKSLYLLLVYRYIHVYKVHI